LFALA
jgi:hypothetical protein